MEIGIVDEYSEEGISRWSRGKGGEGSLTYGFKYVNKNISYFLMPTRF